MSAAADRQTEVDDVAPVDDAMVGSEVHHENATGDDAVVGVELGTAAGGAEPGDADLGPVDQGGAEPAAEHAVVGHGERRTRQLGRGEPAGTGELAVLCGAVIGAGLGFLWFNAPPASIFMGDTGSLALGGMIGTIAVATKHEIVLAVVGGLFVLEAVSVIVQVLSFKLTGKRVFRMAPIHHHFELKGWKENQVVVRFWIITMLLVLGGLSTLKLR